MQSQRQPIASSSSAPSTASASGKPDRLYVGNLSPTLDEYTLIQVFSKYGKITKLDFMFHKTGVLKGKPRGFAFIQFSDKDDALKAMVKLHDRLLRGRKLVVTYASSAPPENASLPTKGRRPTEPAKTTTLSLLKSSKKPQSAAAQIAAMEAKLAVMARTKPADEDYVPGQSSRNGTPNLALGEGSTPVSVEGSPMPDDQEMLGDEEGEMAARDLEREMEKELAKSGPSTTGDDNASDSIAQAAPSPEAGKEVLQGETETGDGPGATHSTSSLPSRPLTSAEQKQQAWKRGLAGLPKRPGL